MPLSNIITVPRLSPFQKACSASDATAMRCRKPEIHFPRSQLCRPIQTLEKKLALHFGSVQTAGSSVRLCLFAAIGCPTRSSQYQFPQFPPHGTEYMLLHSRASSGDKAWYPNPRGAPLCIMKGPLGVRLRLTTDCPLKRIFGRLRQNRTSLPFSRPLLGLVRTKPTFFSKDSETLYSGTSK